MELRHIRYFLAVAEELHFRQAADKLFISQPGLSRQIKQMEEELGVTLFERHNRKVDLTDEGAYLMDELTGLIKKMDKVFEHAQLMSLGVKGKLRLGYIGSAMQKIVPAFLLRLKDKYPDVKVELEEMDNQVQVTGVLNDDIDIGFVRMDRVPRGLEIIPLQKETFSLVLPDDHPLDLSNFKDLSQVADESFILFDPSYSPLYYEKVMQMFDHAGFVPMISHKSIKANTIYRLIENHFGVAIVPSSLEDGYDMNIKFIKLDKIEQRTTLQLIWNQENRNPVMNGVLGLF